MENLKENTTILHIRTMDSKSCIKVVKDEITNLGIEYKNVRNGEAEIIGEISDELYKTLDKNLKEYDMGLIKSKDEIIRKDIKIVIIAMVNEVERPDNEKNSDYIERKMGYGYDYLSRIFPDSDGITIQDFTNNIIIKEAKILILENELSFDDIAHRLHFNYTSFFSRFFKKISGISPSIYRKQNQKNKD